jgi:Protein of unknown function (DUF4238)
MTDQAKRHHVVSRFYLRYFADESEQVTTVMLPGTRVFTQSIANASVQTRYYTAVAADGQQTDLAEKAFAEIEGHAAEAWRLISNDVWPLPTDARIHVAAWIALQLLRGNAIRASMNDIGTDLLRLQIAMGGRTQLKEALSELGEPSDDDSVTREWISLFADPLQVQVHANHHLYQLASMLPSVTQSLLDRWWLLTTYERKGLATSDHPVSVIPNDAHREIGLGTGIENADIIHLPLTRRHSLAMALRSSLATELAGVGADGADRGVAATALYSNSCTANNARRMVFHHPSDRPLTGLELPQPRVREVETGVEAWAWMTAEDRQVLLDAGVEPPNGTVSGADPPSQRM